MKKIIIIIILSSLYSVSGVCQQPADDTTVFLLTCGPGTETYSIYGHSAVRITIPSKNSDIVYNWGMFDFSTPNFTWKFAKGRLDYMLGAESMQSFLQIYFYEKRFVYSQKLNLNTVEKEKLIAEINENLKPENVKYRYDFFYDDCSTRIRDLIEKSIGEKLLYQPVLKGDVPTFRDMVGKYQIHYPWLNLGIDLIMGSPGDKKVSSRDRMFLPLDLKDELSEAVINRDGKMIPLLQNPEVILNFDSPVIHKKFISTPSFIFTILFIAVLIFTAMIKNKRFINLIDIIIYITFSILAVMMIFFNFFTDHLQMKWNLNILWINPIILICLLSVILRKNWFVWFRILFYTSGIFLVMHFLLPQAFNIAFIPLALILLIRSSVRAQFEWNPLSIK